MVNTKIQKHDKTSRAVKNPQSRRWNVTIENPEKYGETRDIIIDKLESISYGYACLGFEIGADGTEHFHFYIEKYAPIAFNTIKNLFPSAHIEKAMGTSQQNVEYIFKIGEHANTDKAETHYPEYDWENGTRSEGNTNSSKKLIDLVKSGMAKPQIIELYPIYLNRTRVIDELWSMYSPFKTTEREVEVTYIFGKTGLGKTHLIHERHGYKDVCTITNYRDSGEKVYFDSYCGQDVLVLDEFHSNASLPSMLRWLDKYPVDLPARYNDKTACYTKVYIVSNIPLAEQFTTIQDEDPSTWNAFIRRLSHIYEFTNYGVYRELQKDDYYADVQIPF